MLANTMNWKVVLRQHGILINNIHAIKSIGLSIFAKYIPGKIMMILGRSEYVSKFYKIGRKKTAIISFETQIISIWVGLSLGILGIVFNKNILMNRLSYIVILFWLSLSLLIISAFARHSIEKLSKLILKKTISIPQLSFKSLIFVLPYFILNWALWCLGFLFLCFALSPQSTIPASAGFLFSLAASLSILAIIAPGGIGVREGLLSLFLTQIGLSIELSTSISLASRLWFLIGEIFIFVFALIINPKSTIE